MMKKFASHRLYIPHLDLFLRNQVVEIDDNTGIVVSYYPFKEETGFTEWLNGLIVLSYNTVLISLKSEGIPSGEFNVLYIDKDKNIRSVLPPHGGDTFLNAYYITFFNVSEMCFSSDSRAVKLI